MTLQKNSPQVASIYNVSSPSNGGDQRRDEMGRKGIPENQQHGASKNEGAQSDKEGAFFEDDGEGQSAGAQGNAADGGKAAAADSGKAAAPMPSANAMPDGATVASGGRHYISRIKFRGFKSFKNAEVQMPHGFVALAGPNGSGKSNVTDAIRFALGEMSLKSLRAKKVTELINQNSSKAEVTLCIGGDRKFEIRRAIREDGKTSYHLDGRHLTRTQVLEALRPYGIETGSHNIIAQGQVQKIVEMNSKERRAIIDANAGIAEFDGKKKEALSELGKVDARIFEAKIMLSERGAYLAELEKEKNSALSYQEAQGTLSSARATLVHSEYEKLDRHFSELLNKKKEAGAEIAKLEAEGSTLGKQMKELEEKRKVLADKMGSNKEREKLLAQIEALKVRGAQEGVRAEEARLRIDKSEEEHSASLEEQKRIRKALGEMEKEGKEQLDGLLKLKNDLEERKKKAGIGSDTQEEAKKELDLLQESLSKLAAQRGALEAGSQKGDQIVEMIKERLSEAKEEIAKLERETGGGSGKAEKYMETVKGLTGELEKLFDTEKDLNRRLPGLDRELLEKKEALAALRGSVSPAAQNPALLFVMQQKKDGEGGIFGTVSDLIGVEEKYRVAVEASAGARLIYVVVDCLDTANRVIGKLKENRAGRCTFIPLDRPMGSEEGDGGGGLGGASRLEAGNARLEPSESRHGLRGRSPLGLAKAGLGRLADFVTYERKFWPAISYVFGDTVLTGSVAEAKRLGIGNYRMVTLDGELIERAGIVTGGSLRGSLMARSTLTKTEAEAEELKKLRDGTFAELYEVRDSMQRLRRERAEAEIKIRSIEAETGGAGALAKRKEDLGAEIASQGKELAKAEAQVEEETEKVAKLAKEITAVERGVEEGRKKAAAEDEKRKKVSSEAQAKYHEAFEKYTNAESMQNSRKREFEMLSAQLSELEARHKKGAAEIASAKSSLSAIEGGKARLEAEQGKLEATLNEISASVQKLYAQMQAHQAELENAGAQFGKLNAAKDSRAREINDLNVRLASAETKLADLKAEWEKYSGIKLLEEGRARLEEMVKECEARLSSLGNVNMKAPEMFEQKQKEHKEMQGKVGTLESEKAAVMMLIEEIDQKKRSIFMKTFHEVNTHFRKLFCLVFKGEGILVLDEPENPLESGLSFRVRGENDKKDRYLNSMSGGEQTLLSMMFIFALQMHRPAPFYIMDEVEAALDKENSHKMADFVKQMSKNAQFIVVTHNDAVLSAADVALGVMKTDDGSKIVGVQLEGAIALAAEARPPMPPKEKTAGGDGNAAPSGAVSGAKIVEEAEVKVKKKR